MDGWAASLWPCGKSAAAALLFLRCKVELVVRHDMMLHTSSDEMIP